EDFGYMLEGYRSGILTQERLDDAVTRILGLKAFLKLPEKQRAGTLIPPREDLSVVGCREHLEMAAEAAKKSITLVKDTQHNLPVKPATHKRAYVYVISSPPISRGNKPDPAKKLVQEEMERYGYEVTMHDSFYDVSL